MTDEVMRCDAVHCRLGPMRHGILKRQARVCMHVQCTSPLHGLVRSGPSKSFRKFSIPKRASKQPSDRARARTI